MTADHAGLSPPNPDGETRAARPPDTVSKTDTSPEPETDWDHWKEPQEQARQLITGEV